MPEKPKRKVHVQKVRVQLALEPQFWRLLARYTLLLSNKLKKRKLPKVSYNRVIAALLMQFLLENRQRIIDETRQATYDDLQATYARTFSTADLRALGFSKIPRARGEGSDEAGGGTSKRAKNNVSGTRGRRSGATKRRAGAPRKVPRGDGSSAD